MTQMKAAGGDTQSNNLAEQAIITYLFHYPELITSIADRLLPEDFYEARHGLIYSTVLRLFQDGRKFDPITVISELAKENQLIAVGGIPYIQEVLLADNQMAKYSGDIAGYVEIIKDLSLRRKLLELSSDIQENAVLGTGLSADEALTATESRIIELAQTDTTNAPVLIKDAWEETYNLIQEAAEMEEGATTGIPSGFPTLDSMTSGWLPGQVIIIAARPSVGKSALAADFARSAAFLSNKTVLFFNLEMSMHEMMLRIISAQGLIPLTNLKKGLFNKEELMKLEAVKKEIQSARLYIDTNANNITLSKLRAKAIRQKYSPSGLDLIIIDYLQLLSAPQGNRNSTRENEVAALSRGIKLLAKELEVPIILLAQLNRSSEGRQDKRPQLSDLRESGSIEQDADIALLIHRPEQSDPNLRPGEADLIVAKNRNGPTDTIPLNPMLEYSKYTEGDGKYRSDEDDTQGQEFATSTDEEDSGTPIVALPPINEIDNMDWE